ncbi:MAG: arylesterase [Verrucomicrobiota bacterium]
MTHFLTISFALLSLLAASHAEERRILILGDSLTAGYGVDPDQAWPHLIQEKLNASGHKEWKVLNGGVSGDTTSGGLRRLPWLQKRKIHLLVIALGGNDALRGVDPAVTESNLDQMIQLARVANPDVRILLAGMEISDNMGKEYVEQFATVFPSVAKREKIPLIPFLLEGVAGDPERNLPDVIHPNEKGHQAIADLVWPYLCEILPSP